MVDESTKFYSFLSEEDKHHVKVVEFMNENYPNVIFTHIPTEGKKSFFERYKHSIMGAKTGICDFVFLHPKYTEVNNENPPYRILVSHGLALELKAPSHERLRKERRLAR